MKRLATFILKNCWFGIVYVVVAVAASLIYIQLNGPLFGVMNLVETTFLVLLLGIFGLAGLVAFFRQPNPYGRTYALYDLKDLPPKLDELDSGGSGWLWQVAPITIAAAVLLPFFA